MTAPLVSIVVPAYNYAHTLGAAIDSVLIQGLESIEVIVCDDCSTDATSAVVASYCADPRVRYLRQEKNLGLIGNSNAGLAAARGEYVIILSADDMLVPGYFQKVFAWKRAHPEIDIVYTQFYLLNEAGTEAILSPPHVASSYSGGRNEFASLLEFGCVNFFGSALVPRRLYEQYGYFRPEVAAANDLDIMLRWAAQGVSFGYLAEPLVGFRIHDKQLSGSDRYGQTGLLLTEFLDIFTTHVTPERHDTIRGHAAGIARHLQIKHAIVKQAGFRDDGSLEAALAGPLQTLQTLSDEHRARPRPMHLGVVLLDCDELDALYRTVADVFAQTYSHWEILLVSSRPAAEFSALRSADTQGRVKLVEVPAEMPQGRKLNTAMQVTNADTFCYFRAGTRIIDDYFACVNNVFSTTATDVVLTTPQLLAHVQTDQYVHDVFLPLEHINDLPIAPCIILESLVVRREMLDVNYVFNAELKSLAEWELLLRMRHEANFTLLPQLRVQIYASTAGLQSFDAPQSLLGIFGIVAGLYEISAPERSAQREAYGAALRELVANWDSLRTDHAGIGEIYRIMYGRRALEAARPLVAV